MRAKELIIGHYEGSLTPAEQQELTALLASSPEARAAYERHGVIEETLEEDARRMVVPVGLREATVAAAIGVSAEAVGWGIGGWLTGKVAAVIGTVVVGGTVMGVVIANDDDETRNPIVPTASPTMDTEGRDGVPTESGSSIDNGDEIVKPIEKSTSNSSRTNGPEPKKGTNDNASLNDAAGSGRPTELKGGSNGVVEDFKLGDEDPVEMDTSAPRISTNPPNN